MSHSRKGPVFAWTAALIVALGGGALLWQKSVVGEEGPKPAAAAVEQANSLSLAFRKAAEIASPTVVKIRSHANAREVSRDASRGLGQGENPFRGTPFEDFYDEGQLRDFRRQIPERDGVGSGVIIDASGIVLTNNHVVENADEVTVTLNDGREFRASDIKTDPQSDLAVLRIKADGDLPAAKLGDSDLLEIGDWVIAIGNPFELETTVSAGIISGKGRELSGIRRSKFLQTDAAINPGNSGGPLVNLNGEIVGVNTAIASNSGGYQGIGFAIPINQARWITDQLIRSGSVQRAYLGVGIEEVTADLAEQLKVDRGAGVLVSEVFPNSPASAAGFEEGDLIVGFAGKSVAKPRDLQEIVERTQLESRQAVDVIRDGRQTTLQVTLKALPDELAMGAPSLRRSPGDNEGDVDDSSYREDLGLEVTEVTGDVAKEAGFEGYEGVLITNVDDDGPAAAKGLTSGMLIRKVGRQSVSNLDEFKRALEGESLQDGIMLQVRSQEGNRFVVLEERS